jgi:hypothetical protein
MERTAALIAIAGLLLGAIPAAAQPAACSARGEVVKHLSSEYSESPVAIGLANNGGVVEILSSKAGQSWTIILTMPNGVSCLIAAGENWEEVPHLVSGGGPGA